MWSYFGGKFFQAPWIEQFIPSDIKTYVEPFSGAMWVYVKSELGTNIIAYPELENIIYNDLNKNNVNIWNCLKKDVNKLHQMLVDLRWEAGADDTFIRFQEELNVENGDETSNLVNEFDLNWDNPDFERAVKYIFLLTQTFSGVSLNRSRTMVPLGKHRQFWAFAKKLENNKNRQKIKALTAIENMDYKDLISKYNNKDTFFYLDPPYFQVAVYTTDTFDSILEHEKLAKLLKSLKGRWALSYYHFPELEEWFPKNKYHWESRIYNKIGGNTKQGEKNKSEELLIMNY